jgi:hypothetical protein
LSRYIAPPNIWSKPEGREYDKGDRQLGGHNWYRHLNTQRYAPVWSIARAEPHNAVT